jgi:cellulose synthase/poly-beta-1,6-N-acetylglucosamine synthase-like glycosyltransferase
VVDGSQNESAVRDKVLGAGRVHGEALDLRYTPSRPGLTRQRNVGLRSFRGDVVCFLDDDVTLGADFLSRLVAVFQSPGTEELGGVGGYNTLPRPSRIPFRRRFRSWLARLQRLDPGSLDGLGRPVLLSDLKSPSGREPVRWVSGFCMAFRREAVAGPATADFGG